MAKVRYGLSNVYYAKATIANDGTATYETPVAIPGAVNLTLDPEGESNVFRADNINYYTSTANSGYSGSIEFAIVPTSFRTDILGDIEHTDKVVYENADAATQPFALIAQIEQDDGVPVKFVWYNCTAARTSTNAETTGTTIEPTTETLDLTVGMIKNTVLNKNLVKAYCEDTTATSYATWTKEVHQPA